MQHLIWNIDPTIHLGMIKIHWYSLFFVLSFYIALALMKWIYKREGRDVNSLNHAIFYAFIGTIVGARLAHCFFYDPQFYLDHPIKILHLWDGGLASHGGMLGIIIGLWIFARVHHQPLFWLLSRMTIVGMVTASMVRIGNFSNSEILGKATDLPWAIIFQRVDMIPRHPVQLYEAFTNLIILFILLTIYKKVSFDMATKILGPLFFLLLFGTRFILEYFKIKQAHYSIDIPWTTGQLLSLPFIVIGIIWLLWLGYNYFREKN